MTLIIFVECLVMAMVAVHMAVFIRFEMKIKKR